MSESTVDRRQILALLGLTVGVGCDHGVKKDSPSLPAPRLQSTPDATPSIEAESIHPRVKLADDGPRSVNHDQALPTRSTIFLQPLGKESSTKDSTFVVDALKVFFPHPIEKLPLRALPAYAYYKPRNRYRAEKILGELEKLTLENAQVVVGLTTSDISTTKGEHEDWGILGLASLGGEQCVVSRFRAQRKSSGDEQTRVRLAKVVAHEVGHTLGLDHCPTAGCLMGDGEGSVLTVDRDYDFCDTCRSQVRSDLNPRELLAIPWPNPGVSWPAP